jgi:hypothetical protein
MKQTIIIENPPIFERASKVFDIIDKPILFSWGDKIYNPKGVDVPKYLLAHESVHGDQQGTDEAGILEWWDRYLKDEKFRIAEEVPAHRAEYLALVKRHNDKREYYLKRVAEKLSAPLYGSLVTSAEARELIMVIQRR